MGALLGVVGYGLVKLAEYSGALHRAPLVVAALIVGVFRNGLTLMGVSSVYQILVTGILVILAVTTDQLSRKGARR